MSYKVICNISESEIKENLPNKNSFYSLSDIKILIIDDDVDLCNSIKFFFEDHNSTVFSSNSGEEGLGIFEKEKPDIVLVDLNMPGVDGHKVISSISAISPDTPIVVVSGTGIIKEAIRSMNLGAWDFVCKPILNFEELEMSVLRGLEKANLIRENKNYKHNLEILVEKRTLQLANTIDELKFAKEKAEASDKMKTEFLNQISHEVRTPLNAIISYANMLRYTTNEALAKEVEENFSIITRASERLIRTIEHMITISELNAGSYNYKPELFELNEFLEDLLYKIAERYKKKNLKFTINCEASLCSVFLDKNSIEQIFSNLIENAFKFTEKGEVLISLLMENRKLKVIIIDTGIGISTDYMRVMYEPFTQEEQGINRRYEGNGLGLTLVRKFCELNSIDIDVQSNKSVGTKVSLLFNDNQKRINTELHFYR